MFRLEFCSILGCAERGERTERTRHRVNVQQLKTVAVVISLLILTI